MRIALDFNAVISHRFSGFYSYGVGLLKGFAQLAERHRLVLFHSKRHADEVQNICEAYLQVSEPRATLFKMRWLENLWQYSSYPSLEAFTGKFDIYHCIHHLMPPTNSRPRVMTVHDLRRYRLGELYQKSKLKYFERAVRQADHFIAVSESTKNDLCELFEVAPEKVDVTHLAADEELGPLSEAEKRRIKTKLSELVKAPLKRYIVTFSSRDRRKNVQRTINAFRIAQGRLPPDIKLVIIGKPPRDDKQFSEGNGTSLGGNIICAGTVSDVAQWLGCAEALVFASLYEGFGIPIAEAFASGVPVITSNCSSMPEVAGGAGLLVDPYDEKSICEAMVSICSDSELRGNLIEAGLERKAKFSWRETAAKTLRVYKKLL